MKLGPSLKIVEKILKETNISEISFTEAREQTSDKAFDYDLTIIENVSHADIQIIDKILADYDNVEMRIDLNDSEIRIFEVEPEEKRRLPN